jgi:hypothetical protein
VLYELLILFRGELLIELSTQRRNHTEAVWTVLLADVHLLDEAVFQRVDVLDHSVEEHFAG